MNIETMTLPIISTAHLTKEVADRLESEGDKNPWVICAPYECGFFLWIGEGNDGELDMPQCLRDIRDAIIKIFHRGPGAWVRLECDADKLPDLPAYEW